MSGQNLELLCSLLQSLAALPREAQMRVFLGGLDDLPPADAEADEQKGA